MKYTIIGIADRGVLEKERIHLRAIADIQSAYIIVESEWTAEGRIMITGNKQPFWLPKMEIKQGETMVLYTRDGSNSVEALPAGKVHFVFRGLKEPLYADPKRTFTIAEVADWATAQAGTAPASAKV